MSIGTICLAFGVTASAWAPDIPYMQGVKAFNEKRYQEASRLMTQSMGQHRNASNLYYAALSKIYLRDTAGATVLMREIESEFPRSAEAANASQYLSRPTPVSSNGVVNYGNHAAIHSTVSSGKQGVKPAVKNAASDFDSLPNEAIIPFKRGIGGHMMVEGQLNGRTMSMIFDTGAECCAFGQNQLNAAGITQKGQYAGFANGVGGQVNLSQIDAEITVGNLKRKIPLMVQNQMDVPPLLGETFFAGYSYAIDSSAGIIRLTKKGTSSAASSIGFDTIDVPYCINGKNMMVNLEINGQLIQACFDTGAAGVVLSSTDAANLGIQIPADSGWGQSSGIGGQVLSACFNVRSVRMGSIQKTNFPIRVLMGALPYPLVGQSFFGDRKFTVDQDKQIIHFAR